MFVCMTLVSWNQHIFLFILMCIISAAIIKPWNLHFHTDTISKKKQDQSIAHDCWICMATVVICYFFYLILIHFGIHKHMGSTILIMDLQNAESLSLSPFGCQFPFCFAFAPTDVFHLKLITHELITIGRKMKNRLLWVKG